MSSVPERIALISDVHGNLTALEAVLADIDARGITRIFNLGDYVGKGPRGREVVELCRERCEVNLLGNWDDFLPDPAREFDSPALQWWLDQLGPGDGEWLRGLPFSHDFSMSGRQIRLMHASAETVHRRVRYVHTTQEFLGQFANTAATGNGPVPDVVGLRRLPRPAVRDAAARAAPSSTPAASATAWAIPRRSTASSRGCLDSSVPAPFSIAFVRVPYDVDAELAARPADRRIRSTTGTSSSSGTGSTGATSTSGRPAR